ncbi:ATP-dependent DNA helicase PIF4 [Zea mays]|uniref:ATP-dependent DNA helicase n=1 Tax=Zea mays TaxID=4577 RepID=A0A3L6G4X6_MAIZE|nr:ATP-dependent DNA helicase PIF4 [Zea mays]
MAPRILIFKPRTNKSRSDRDPHAVLPVNYHLLNSHAMDCSDIPAICAVKELISITSRHRPHPSRPAPQPKSSCDREPLAAARKIVSHQPTGYRSRAPRSRSSADLLSWKPNDLAIAARLFDDYRDEDFYGLPRKYNIVARVEVKFPIEPRYRDSQHFILSDINGSKIEAMTSSYETVKHFDSLINEKHVYKMHNVEFSINLGDRFRHISGPMELYLTRQTVVEPYTVPFQMSPFPKHIFLNLAAIAELPNRTLVDIMAIVVHLDTVQHTMWGNVRKIVVMDARWSLHTIKVRGDLLNKNALRWALANENYGIIIGTMFRRFRRQEYLESSDYTAIHFNPYHHSTHHFEPIRKALMERGHDRQFAITFLEEKRNPCQGGTVATNGNACMSEQGSGVVHGQTKPRVISNGDDDDEGIIFEEDDDENEGYLFTGQYEGTDEDINIHGTQDESTATDVPDPYDNVYNNIPEETHMLKPVPDCGYCTAKKFEYEPPGFCCRGGKVELAPLETPPQLKRLWDSTDSDARHFRDNIRFFNGHFSFTSLYCCLDSMTTNVRDSGIYTFRAQGMMYHNIKSFGREGGAEHKHLELYFYDDDPSLEHRYRKCRADQLQRDKEVIRQIVGILRGNPYSEHLRSMGHVENLDDYYIALNLDQTLNQKTYNAPLTSEVAAVWIEGSERRGQFSKSVMLHGKDRSNHGIRSYHGCYDALSYPLFFPKGELGWHANIPKVGVSMDEVDAYRAKKRASNANDEDAESPIHLCVSVRDYYCYKFQIRPGLFNPILHGKRLFQQFAVDTYIKIESSRLDFIRNNQERLRADLYQGLVDSMVDGDIRAEKVGKRTVLSPSFIGGPRDMRRRYMDAMALVRKFGKPDIFLTMTCNPNWDEIRRELLPDQTPQDRPDLVVRVFHAKLQELKHRLTKQDILGKVRAYVYVVEFQKRGLPHAHFLLIMQRKYKLTCPEQYDLLISAEIPSNKYPELRKMVIKHMMHGPCGSLNPNCPCTKGRASCKNQYPRPYSEATLQGKDSYPIYRRRDNGRKEKVRGCELDNRWVVPYNPYLLRLFNCHINVEACGSIKAVKYLFKYIYKGHDRASVVMRDASKAKDDVDEIKQYRDARWVTPPEALWRIYGFELSQISPPVMQLQLHLPNMHMVTFHERQMVERVINRKGADRSMLTAYFEENRMHKEARNILYRDFPEWYTWQQGKVWQRRKRNTGGKVGRIVSALPAEGERFYLRLLLNHVTGATSFADLRTVDGDILPSFREAAQRRGLLEADDTIDECLNEAALYQMPSALRRLFATILVYCEPNDVAELWQRHLDAMSEDYHRSTQSKTHVQQMVLIDIRNILQSMGKDIKTFPLPAIIDIYDNSHGTDREIYEEECIEPTTEDIALKETLNEEQRSAYDKILSVVDTNNGGVFFVDGPGGTRKTYLYKALLAALRSQDKIAVATATSGVAASIMPGGRTAHSRFKIPLTIDDGAVCSFTKQSGTAKLLQKASLIIWDEASMAKRQAIEALDNSMRDIMGRTGVPFGGKTIVFGGDFRQVLPVVRKGSRAQIVAASLRSSYLWESMCHLKLVRNMRAQSDPWFAEYLLRVGGGTEEENNDGDVRLPDEVCVPYTGNDHDLDRLIDDIYPKLNENMSNTSYITSRAILTTRNDWVDMINMRMINRFQGEQMMYHSFDTAMDDPNNYYPSEFLNTLTPNGLPRMF